MNSNDIIWYRETHWNTSNCCHFFAKRVVLLLSTVADAIWPWGNEDEEVPSTFLGCRDLMFIFCGGSWPILLEVLPILADKDSIDLRVVPIFVHAIPNFWAKLLQDDWSTDRRCSRRPGCCRAKGLRRDPFSYASWNAWEMRSKFWSNSSFRQHLFESWPNSGLFEHFLDVLAHY